MKRSYNELQQNLTDNTRALINLSLSFARNRETTELPQLSNNGKQQNFVSIGIGGS